MKAGYNTTIGYVAALTGGTIIHGSAGTPIGTITTDSRDLGERNLFIPLMGEKFDGHDFIHELCVNRRIDALLTMRDGYEKAASDNGVAMVRCADTLGALGAIGSAQRKNISPILVGITGTNGKTTVKELIYSLLSAKYKCHRNEKNYNNEIGVPFTLLGLREGDNMAVIEMGMNHPGELERLSRITAPDAAVITNIGEGHLEFFGTIENVARAKCEIMEGMPSGAPLFINRETACFEIARDRALAGGLAVRTFGVKSGADFYPESYSLDGAGITLKLKDGEVWAPLYGIHNVYNLIAAVQVGLEYGLTLKEMGKALTGFTNAGGRSQVIDRGYLVIDDTYNSNPLSAKYALRSVKEIFPDLRKIAVLSDMKELGAAAEPLHRETGEEAARNGFDLLLLWGDMSEAYASGAVTGGMDRNRVKIFKSKGDIITSLTGSVSIGDVILVKGSRSMKMEEIVRALAG